jgi:hypothetical protein
MPLRVYSYAHNEKSKSVSRARLPFFTSELRVQQSSWNVSRTSIREQRLRVTRLDRAKSYAQRGFYTFILAAFSKWLDFLLGLFRQRNLAIIKWLPQLAKLLL